MITEREVVEAALRRHPFRTIEKFLQEVLWRGYWKGWLELRPQVWEDYAAALRGLSESSSAAQAGREVAEGRSRSGIMNHFARELIETGYLHNHARMWWASYWIHHCGLRWELGARFFMEHLLDADAASNTLSWRWVAGRQTRGKTYLATEQNITKFCAPELVEQAGGIGIGGGVAARVGAMDDVVSDEIQVRPDFPHEIGVLDEQSCVAVVLHDEDFCLETSPAAGLRPKVLLHLVPPDESPVAEPRAHWLGQARSDAVARAREHFRCEVRVCRTCDDIMRACLEVNAGQAVMMEPFVGPLRDSLQGLPEALATRDIGLVRLRRKWDSALQPYAERGFFPFWNKVGRLLARSGAEELA
ncbi:MAG: FAD-binding domain-containing protein [Chthoniobacterales bacterium]